MWSIIFWVPKLFEHVIFFLMLHAYNGRIDINNCILIVLWIRMIRIACIRVFILVMLVQVWILRKFHFKDVWTTCLVSGLIAVFWRERVSHHPTFESDIGDSANCNRAVELFHSRWNFNLASDWAECPCRVS